MNIDGPNEWWDELLKIAGPGPKMQKDHAKILEEENLQSKLFTFLKRKLFNDAVSCYHTMGCNHNASDRSCMTDVAAFQSVQPDFEDKYQETEELYYQNIADGKRFTDFYCGDKPFNPDMFNHVKTTIEPIEWAGVVDDVPTYSLKEQFDLEEYAADRARVNLEFLNQMRNDPEWVAKAKADHAAYLQSEDYKTFQNALYEREELERTNKKIAEIYDK